MMKKIAEWFALLGVLFSIVSTVSYADNLPVQLPHREVAVTFDDLPFVVGYTDDWTVLRSRADKLIQQITASHIPAVGFVNESKLYGHNSQLNEQGVAILNDWLNAGLELGNHTFSHLSLSVIPLDQFEQDVIRGETVTKPMMAAHDMQLRYFRHPYLQVGNNTTSRAAFERFLAEHGYTVAPVTINHAEWVFAAAYDKAAQRGNQAEMQRVAEAYIPYMKKIFIKAEQLSVDLFGRENRQILLLHANALNADHFSELIEMMKQRGYIFITLADALQDKAYASQNTYAGQIGLSWLDQWALTVGLTIKKDEPVPSFVRGLADLPVVTYQGY